MDILFKQDTCDISFTEDFDLDIVAESSEDLMQRLYVRFKTFARDLIWNESYGIDFLNDVFGKNRPKNTVDDILKREIEKEQMVEKILLYESEIVNYTYSCFFDVTVLEDQGVERLYILLNDTGLRITNENNKSILIKI